MFLIIFSVALIIANIYFFVKKEYLYLFVPCMLFLPEYYGIELSSSLPILTATRIMFVIFYIYAFINRKRNISFKGLTFSTLPKEYIFLGCYFVLRLIPTLNCLRTYPGSAVKGISLLIFEQLMFLISIYLLNPSHADIIKLLKAIVYTACGFYIVGIFESFTGIRPFDYLYSVNRLMLNDYFVRLGFLRSTTTFGLPGLYGNMCLLTLPLILYLYEISREKKYLFICFFNLLAMIHSGCRSDIFFYGILLFIYFVFVIRKKDRKILFIKNCLIVFLMLLIFIVPLSIVSDRCNYYYTGTIKSILNEVGFNFNLEEDLPEGVDGYGGNNNNGSTSRLVQFSGMRYTMGKSPLLGFGPNAITRDAVQYYSYNYWHFTHTYDVGYVQVFCDEGIVGFTGYILLFVALIWAIIKSRKNKNEALNNRYKLFFITTYLLCMLSTANMYAFLMTLIIICSVYKYTDS